MVHAVGAHRSQQHASDRAPSPRAHYEELGILGSLDQEGSRLLLVGERSLDLHPLPFDVLGQHGPQERFGVLPAGIFG